MIYEETSGTNPDDIYQINPLGSPSAWGEAWNIFWSNSWGFTRVTPPYSNTSGANPDIIYEET